MINILAHYAGIAQCAKTYHWICKQGPQEFYGNHELFDRIAEEFNPFSDDFDKMVEQFFMSTNREQIKELYDLWFKASHVEIPHLDEEGIEFMKDELIRRLNELNELIAKYKHKNRGINAILDEYSGKCNQMLGLLKAGLHS